VIETEGGKTFLLQTEEFFELARQMTPADFQAVVADAMKAQAVRIMTLETVCGGLLADIRRLKTWTGLPELNDPRGPAPHTLWQMAGLTRDLVLHILKHLGLDMDDFLPPTRGGVN